MVRTTARPRGRPRAPEKYPGYSVADLAFVIESDIAEYNVFGMPVDEITLRTGIRKPRWTPVIKLLLEQGKIKRRSYPNKEDAPDVYVYVPRNER